MKKLSNELMNSEKPSDNKPVRRRSGWPPARRARQAALIRTWKPWARSTGPKTAAGKARAMRNSHKHGAYSAAAHDLRYLLTVQARYLRALRAALRMDSPGNITARPRVIHHDPVRAARLRNVTRPSGMLINARGVCAGQGSCATISAKTNMQTKMR